MKHETQSSLNIHINNEYISHVAAAIIELYNPPTILDDVKNTLEPLLAKLPEIERIEIAKLVAVERPKVLSKTFQSYFINNEEAKLDIASICAYQHGRRISEFIKNYNISSEQYKVKVAKIAASQNGEGTSKFISNYEIESTIFRTDVAKIALLNDVNTLSLLNNYFPESKTSTICVNPQINDILQWLNSNSQNNESYLIPDVVSVYSDMQRRDAGIKLIAGYLGQKPDSLGAGKEGSRKALQNLTGLPSHYLALQNYSTNTLGDLYETLLDVQSKCPVPFFSEIRISDDIFKVDSKLIKLMAFINGVNLLLQVSNDSCETFNLVVDTIKTSNSDAPLGFPSTDIKIDINKITEITKMIKLLFVERQNMLSAHELNELTAKWGSIESLISLAARFSGKATWKRELPILKKVVEMELKGQFSQYKYFGDSNDLEDLKLLSEQVEFMEPSQYEIWKKNYSLVKVLDTIEETKKSEEEIIQTFISKLEVMVYKHFNKSVNNETLSIIDENFFDDLIDKDLQKRLKLLHANNVENMQIHSLYALMKESSLSVLRKRISKVKSVWDFLRFSKELKNDLSLASKEIFPEKKKKKSIVFTTSIDDAKNLLENGCLVNTSSCHNYKNGSEIHTLPGIVIDANTKIIASFAVVPGPDLSNDEFEFICSEIKNKSINFRYSFDPYSKMLSFVSENGKEIQVQLNLAFHRQTLKIGKTSIGNIGIKLEPPVIQKWVGNSFMQECVNEIFESIAMDMKASLGEPVLVSKSRNPLGTYSDSALTRKGVQTNSYTLG